MARGESVNRNTIAGELLVSLPHLSNRQASGIVDSIVTCFSEKFMEGEEVKISGFGKFTIQEKSPRKGRNPQTGEEILIGARRVVRFQVSPTLRDTLNSQLVG